MTVTATYGDLDLTDYPYSLVFGADFGAPENVTQALAFLLQDGEIELTDRTSNRTIQFQLLIEGTDLADLAGNEAALMLEANKPRNTLTIESGDNAPATVYETYRAQVVWNRDDDYDMNRVRLYAVTMRAMPSARSESEVVAAALSTSGTTTTLVNNGSATTNWTGSVSSGSLTGPTVVSGAVKVGTTAALYGEVTVSATLTTAVTTSSTKYLDVDWKPEQPTGVLKLRAYGDGIELTRVAEKVSPSAGYIRTTFYVAASSIAALRLDSTSNVQDPAVFGDGIQAALVRSLYVDNINRTDVKPTIGTARQLLRSVPVAGSARAQGSLAIEHSTNALGDALVYVYPSTAVGYSPPLRQYRVAGGATTTTDTTLVSGARDAINGATATFDVPAAQLVPGMHTLMVRAASGTGLDQDVTFSWTAETRIGSTTVGATESGSRFVTALGSYTMLALTRVILPTRDLQLGSAAATVRITITASASGDIRLDEAWLFSEIGALIGPVSCGTGTAAAGGPARRLFVESPSVGTPRPRLMVGHSADRSDAFFPTSVGGWQLLNFEPPEVNVLSVTTNALDASVTLRHFPRWELNAAS